jgi:cell pole-organizing protein PopZ
MSASLKANEPSMEEILASIRRIIADDNGAPADAPAASPEPAAESVEDEDVLDLAMIPAEPAPVDDDIEFREVAEPLLVVPPHLLQKEEEEPEPEPPPPPPVFVPRPEPEPESRHAALPPLQPEASLLSEATNASVASAFSALSSTIISHNARTLEDLVKEMLRPMLKGWLDENLPALVERLVKAEIERVTRGPR